MALQRRTPRKTAIVASDTAAALAAYAPDLSNWPRSWRFDDADLPIGQALVECFTPFLIDLLAQGLADKTLRRHRDHLWSLGGELVRLRYDDPKVARLSARTLLLRFVENDGGPLIWPRISESEQRSFDSTCRKLHRFINPPPHP
jgi:hypothetical protein